MFKGLGQLGDVAKMMKQAQEMQSKMADAQKVIEQIEIFGESGGGLVKATTNAKGIIKSIDIDETILLIEIQNSTAEELQNSIGKLKSDIESLSRADVIAKKARNDLKMVFTHPETLRIEIDPILKASL